MDLGPTKPQPKLGRFSLKQVAFFGVAGLILVVGIALRAGHYIGGPAGEDKAPAAVETSTPQTTTVPEAAKAPESAPAPVETTAEPDPETPPATQEAATPPGEPVEQTGDAAQQTGPDGDAAEQLPGGGMMLVARRPVELLAGPSPSAAVMFGFPAGRPFRVIGQEGGFAHIRDLKSGATGWIDKEALAPPAPLATAPPPRAAPAAGGQKPSKASAPKAAPKETPVAEESAPAAEPRKRGLFGGDGLFGGLFGKSN
jgi:Bacterial SH3 domain